MREKCQFPIIYTPILVMGSPYKLGTFFFVTL